MTTGRITALVVAMPVLAAALAGCAKSPATGSSVFTGGLSAAEEKQIGRENHPKIIREFNGEYSHRDLESYVDSIGQKLVQVSERRDLKFSFTVLNSDIVNAFATPGGYIYVSRGLIALADNEAQLAGVLAHEIGHITALHHARRYGSSLLANIGLTAVGVLGGQAAAQLGQLGAVSVLQSFSRDNEYESDELGVRYLTRAGYDPNAMAAFLAKLRADSRLSMIRRGESPDAVDQFNYLATHPAPAERVTRATTLAKQAAAANPRLGLADYQKRIDGMLFGDDPDQGFVHGRRFIHPKLRFAFEVPPGFSLFNSPQAVAAFGPDKSRILFDQAPKNYSGTMEGYVEKVWGDGKRLTGLRKLQVNGLDAATAQGTARIDGIAFDARFVAYRMDSRTIYRFLFLTSRNRTADLGAGLDRTMESFRRLSAAEAGRLKPLVLSVVTVRPGDTVTSLAAKMAYEDYRIERFEVLNGLDRNDPLRAGQTVKIVTTAK